MYNSQKDIASIYSIDGRIFYCGLWNGKLLIYDFEKNQSKEVDIGFYEDPVSAFEYLGDNELMIGSFGEGAIILDVKNLSVKYKFL